jgi:PmbA protein
MSANPVDRLGLARTLVEYGTRQGASEIEVSIGEGTESRLNVLNQDVDQLTESVFANINLRVLVDGRTATASSSDFATDTLQRLIHNAIARARLSGQDPFAGLPAAEPVQVRAEDLKIYDPAMPEVTAEQRIAYARTAEAVGLKDPRIKKSKGSSCDTFHWNLALANSKGFAGTYRHSLVNTQVGFQSGEGTNLFEDYWQDSSTHIADAKPAEEIGRVAVERVVRLLGGRRVETQDVPVVFDPQMSAWLLGFIAQCLGGDGIARRASFLTDKLGTTVGSAQVNIVDDGLLVGGRASAPFDNEGVPCRKTVLFDRGVLKSYLVDTYWGRKIKHPATGTGGGSTNLYWAAGPHDPADIIKSVDKGLYFTRYLGLGQEPTTGDISVGAFGLWIEKGQLTYPVSEITVSANLGTLLQGAEMVGNDLEMRDTICAPTIKFAKVSIGGQKS